MQPGRDFLTFSSTDVLARSRVDARRRGIRSAVISLLITLIFLTVLFFVQREIVENESVRIFSVIFIGVGLISVALAFVLYLQARRDLRRVIPGPVLVVDRHGLDVAGQRMAWTDLASFSTRRRYLSGPEYVIKGRDGRTMVLGVEHLANFPATIDSAVRIFSDGRSAIDLSGIDH